MLIIAWMLVVGPMEGETAVRYLFSRFRLNWSGVEFSLFSSFARITQLMGKFGNYTCT